MRPQIGVRVGRRALKTREWKTRDVKNTVSAIVSRQRLRSAQQNTLVVPCYRLTTYGRRAFSVAGPTAWNSLPVAFRDPTVSDACFRRHLKTVLFAQQRRHHSVQRRAYSKEFFGVHNFKSSCMMQCTTVSKVTTS